ncbi:MAG: hypothetical protein RBT63_06100 [Bdellovibrionales bacterium]|jgi:hypothetical protein|nr:hypothetical protein [Bdellovibrionales bacterium]
MKPTEIRMARFLSLQRFTSRHTFIPALILVPFFLIGCHSLMESASPYDRGSGYKKTTNEHGETVYRRTQPVAPAPIPIVSPTPYPTYIQPEPVKPVASSNTSSDNGLNLHLELATTKGHLHIGAHIGFQVTSVFEPRLGLSFFSSDTFRSGESSELYAGVDLSSRFYWPGLSTFRPFVGIGAYFGDTKQCVEERNPHTWIREETCEKKFLSAGYAELGFELAQWTVFMRNYSIIRAGINIPSDFFLGVGYRF